MTRAILAASTLVLLTSAAIEPPTIGCMSDADGRLRIVFGVAGTFILGDSGRPCPAPAPSPWMTRREQGRWWLLRIDPGSGAESERIPLDPRARLAIPFEDGSALIAFDHTAAWRGREWELPAEIDRLHAMSADWVQIVTAEGSFALRPGQDAAPFRLPEGGSE